MSKSDVSPTMIIPSGTEIQIDVHGQLSVRTPGNLVIQNSGHYGEIESVEGSIRIESNAEVEAVSVRCAETCYVQGSLTSWKVKAKTIHLEEKAQARIVLQETDGIEIGKNAQLVGNFSSEKELFLLFSRFAQQLRSLPFYFDRKGDPPILAVEEENAAGLLATEGRREPAVDDRRPSPEPTPSVEPVRKASEPGRDLPDQLFFAQVRLEREAKNESYGSTSTRVIEELVKLLKNRDLDTLRHTYETLFGRIVEPGEDIRRAQSSIASHFGEPDAAATADER